MPKSNQINAGLRRIRAVLLLVVAGLFLTAALGGCIIGACDCDDDIDDVIDEFGQPEDMDMEETGGVTTLSIWYWSLGHSFTFEYGDDVDNCCNRTSETFSPIPDYQKPPSNLPDNTGPTAVDQTVGTTKNTPVDITLEAIDAEDDAVTYEITSEPDNGTLTGTAPNLVYSPDTDYVGADDFTWRARDRFAVSNTATVSITVSEGNNGGGGDAPTARNDFYTTPEDSSRIILSSEGVLVNDTDPNNLTLTAILVQDMNSSEGEIDLYADGGFAYLPAEGFTGDANFTYKANNGSEDSNVATVNILVESPEVEPAEAERELESAASMLEIEGPEGRILVSTAIYSGADGPIVRFVCFGVAEVPEVVIETASGSADADVHTVYFMPDVRFSGWVAMPAEAIEAVRINGRRLTWPGIE